MKRAKTRDGLVMVGAASTIAMVEHSTAVVVS